MVRKVLSASLLAVALVLFFATPSRAGLGHGGLHGYRGGFHRYHGGFHRSHFHGHHRGFHGYSPRFYRSYGYSPYFYSPYFYGSFRHPYWYYPVSYFAYPPPGVVDDPQVYIQQPSAESSQAAPQASWYYCGSSQAYYPKVERCAEAWIKVPAIPQQP